MLEPDGSEVGAEKNVEPGRDYFANGAPAQHPFAVLYQGEWETEHDGNAFAVRKHALALSATGIPVILKSFSNVVIGPYGIPEPVPVVGLPALVRKEIRGLNMTSAGVTVPMIKHMVVPSAEKLTRAIMRGVVGPLETPELLMAAQALAYQMTIVYSVWERSSITDLVARHLAQVAENWVPCEQNAELLRAHGVKRVHVIPHPYNPTDDICKLTRRQPHTDGWRLFYSIGKWEPRKGYDALIGAFLRAFLPKEKVVLTIKHSRGSWKDYPTPAESVAKWLEAPAVRRNGWTAERLERRLVLVEKNLPRSKIIELHYRNNIYVSSSHGEAWGLPAFEAKLAGNSLVHVTYGGTRDFADKSDPMVRYTLGEVPVSYGWEPGSLWAEYELGSLMAALVTATVPSKFERPAGFEARFSMASVGRLMRDRVMEIADRIHPRAADYYRQAARVELP